MAEVLNNPQKPLTEAQKWEQILEADGLGADLPPISPGIQVPLGDGLGRKTFKEEEGEDFGNRGRGIDSNMCPIVLGTDLDGVLNQPGQRPVEEEVIGNDENNRPLKIYIGSSRIR